MYVLVYVDDVVFIGNSATLLSKLFTKLSARFSLKDMGQLHYFLGVDVVPTSNGLFLSQTKYIMDLLETIHMTDANEVSTPMASSTSLILHDGSKPIDDTLY